MSDVITSVPTYGLFVRALKIARKLSDVRQPVFSGCFLCASFASFSVTILQMFNHLRRREAIITRNRFADLSLSCSCVPRFIAHGHTLVRGQGLIQKDISSLLFIFFNLNTVIFFYTFYQFEEIKVSKDPFIQSSQR